MPALVAAGLLHATAARAAVIRDAELGFTLTVPAGFTEYPPGLQVPRTRHAFIKGEAGRVDSVLITISAMGGTIGRESLKGSASELPHYEGMKLDLRREKWKAFDVDVMVGVSHLEEVERFVALAQVPLLHEAIQLGVVGPEAQQAELLALLRTLLASLDGPSNWLTDGERSQRLGKAVPGLVALVVGLVFGVIWLIARVRKRA